MATDDEPTEAELAALRAALYRPGAAPDAVDDYLAASDRAARDAPAPVAVAEPVDPEPPAPAPEPRRPRARGPLLVVGLVVLLAAASVAVGVVAGHQAAAPAPAPSATADAPFPPVPGTPIGEMVGGASRTGRFDAGGRGAVVALHCSGTGTITVQIADDPVGRFACSQGRSGGIRRSSLQLEGRFSVRVTATGGADWALTVGALPGA